MLFNSRQICEQYTLLAFLDKKDLQVVLSFFPEEHERFEELAKINRLKKAVEKR